MELECEEMHLSKNVDLIGIASVKRKIKALFFQTKMKLKGKLISIIQQTFF